MNYQKLSLNIDYNSYKRFNNNYFFDKGNKFIWKNQKKRISLHKFK